MSLAPASGIRTYAARSKKVIRFVRHGCTNRPFYHIVVAEQRREQFAPVIEQLGSFDSFANEHNEKLVALDYERIRHWLGKGAIASKPVAELLGLAGFFPIHPRSYMTAWRNRKEQEKKAIEEAAKAAEQKAAELASKANENQTESK